MQVFDRKSYYRVKGIYKIKSLIDDRIYIGSTVDLYARNITHYNSLTGNYHNIEWHEC